MFLKRIDFENFKSFAGKISIPFMEGYTAITGPNGSGKSNIIDGMMFVMGPKSSKVLRAKKLTDMIYKGDKGGVKATYTKVTLVFDNTDRMLSVDADEVKFMRHVKYGGTEDKYYSRFYINDEPSSAEEFDSILTKVRISADGYNMVQQGDVADITTMGNLDRRRIIDGISGIASYDADLQRAMTKKTETQANMDSTNIVLKEVQSQLNQLTKDKEAAQKYMDTKAKLDMAEAQMKFKNLEIAEGKLVQAKENEVKLNKDIEELTAKKNKAIEDIESYTKQYAEVEQQIAERMGPEYQETKQKISDVVLKKGICDDKITTLTDENAELDEKIKADSATLAEEEANLANTNSLFNEKNSLLSTKKDEQKKVKEDIKKISDDMNNAGGESKALNREFNELVKKIDDQNAKVNEIAEKRALAQAQEETATADVAHLEEDLESAKFELKDANWDLEEYRKSVGPMADLALVKKRMADIQQEQNKLYANLKDVQSASDKLTAEYNRLSAEKKFTDNSNGSEAVRTILQMRDRGEIKGVYGTISELASVDAEFETAIATAAGPRMFSIVVESDAVAAEAINILNKNQAGRATFYPLNKMRDGKPRGPAILVEKRTHGYAIDLIKFDPKFRAAFWNVFADTLVVENMDSARSIMGGVRLVTKKGEIIEASGAMTGGTTKNAPKLKFGSASQGRLDEVTKELRDVNEALSNLKAQIEKLEIEKRELGNKVGNEGIANAEVQGKIAKLETNIQACKDKIKSCEKSLEEKNEALAKAKIAKGNADADYTKASEEFEKLKAKRDQVSKRIAEIAPTEINERMNEARGRQDAVNAEVEALNEEILKIKSEKMEQELNCNNLRDGIKADTEKIKDNKNKIATNKKESDAYDVDLKALRKIEAEMESKNKELSDKKEKIANAKVKAEGIRDNSISQIETKGGVLDSTRAAIITTQAEVNEYKEQVSKVDFEIDKPIPPEETLKRRIRDAEDTIAKLGNVNLRAIDDYNEKKERFDTLNKEIAELTKEIEDLEKLMVDLGEKKKGLFMTTYEGIAISFKEIFREISGGGEAYISLENEEDPFQGGLVLNARPKSGKMLTLASLSGGEKSLTALAFIFAIQDYIPSPFYVFDEVDMFLDPINAEIVASYIKKSSANTQFLQITHKPNVLPISNHLVGVTKQSNGVSRVIMEPNIDDIIKQDPEMQKEAA